MGQERQDRLVLPIRKHVGGDKDQVNKRRQVELDSHKREEKERTREELENKEQREEREEKVLRQFDLNSKYGPCTGMTRIERWDRAQELGLNPPQEILTLLSKESTSKDALW
eukprot:CAMPEP_0182616636 /NCGR_PEP_ID=MMETSP1330-20130603/39046_1 /TAXON_ID=464278 /ORGANISM="Picochlorum sp., Strain RCC944" /LENGTH=111 /DNA_ID=CAMNT_0024836693 /DNA_START=73 /DNA_END=405 /DNA_ORIENTATION=-